MDARHLTPASGAKRLPVLHEVSAVTLQTMPGLDL